MSERLNLTSDVAYKGVHLTNQERHIIVDIIHTILPNAKIYVFGSRTRTPNHRYSDVDIAIDNGTKVDVAVIAAIRAELIQSKLPYMVDLLDVNDTSKDFLNSIEGDFVLLW